MSSSRIEQIIEEIEEYVENCRYQPLSTTKIVVNKEELEELLRELRLKTPDEIKRYQKIIGNKDAILADAQEKADQIVREAQEKAASLISQTEIMKQAYGQANETINDANQTGAGHRGRGGQGCREHPHERDLLHGRAPHESLHDHGQFACPRRPRHLIPSPAC
jgi:dsDNA-specific endonuclease/ATPase MutS2